MSAPYRPGQQWPDNRPQRPDRPPPIQFRQEEPPQAPNKGLPWALRIAGLVAVAVVSGLIWYAINNDGQATPTNTGGESGTQQPQGKYRFTAHEDMSEPERDNNCARHAYGEIKEFLEDTKCDHLTRQLFVTELDDGRTVYTSVSVVVMRSENDASELRKRTDEDGSGNVNDVVRDDIVKIGGLEHLSGRDGYKSSQSRSEVIIVESDFAPKDRGDNKKADENVLDDVCEDALRLADVMEAATGSG